MLAIVLLFIFQLSLINLYFPLFIFLFNLFLLGTAKTLSTLSGFIMFFQAFMIGLLFLVNLPEVMNGTAHYGRISTTYSTQFESASNGTAASSAAASSASSSTSSATRRMLLGASSSSASSSAATSSASSSASSSGSAYTDCYKKITKYDGALGRRLAGSGDPNPCPELDVPHWGFCRGKNICCVCACTYYIYKKY